MAEHHYTVYFEPLVESGYRVFFPAIPEIVTWGRTLDEARAMARDALRCHLEGLLADGNPCRWRNVRQKENR
jgi:antitoxin HicB